MSELEVLWRGKRDEELATAFAHIEEYMADAEHVIRSEVARRGLILSHTVEETSKEEPGQVRGPGLFPDLLGKIGTALYYDVRTIRALLVLQKLVL